MLEMFKNVTVVKNQTMWCYLQPIYVGNVIMLLSSHSVSLTRYDSTRFRLGLDLLVTLSTSRK